MIGSAVRRLRSPMLAVMSAGGGLHIGVVERVQPVRQQGDGRSDMGCNQGFPQAVEEVHCLVEKCTNVQIGFHETPLRRGFFVG